MVDASKIKVLGKWVVVMQEQLDLGGLQFHSTAGEEVGLRNKGVIVNVGNVGIMARLMGIRVGATVYYRKYFRANDGSQDPVVFVELENITAIERK